MGQLLYPTNKNINGPWLLSRKDFEELDRTIVTIGSLLENSLEQEVKDYVIANCEKSEITEGELQKKIAEQKKRYPYDSKKTSIVLISENDLRLRDNSLKGILKANAIPDLKPKGLYINLEFGYNNKFQFEVTNKYDGELKYDFNCYDSNISDEIKFEIEKWIEEKDPSKVLQFWSKAGGLIFSLLLLPIFVGLTLTLFFNKQYTSYNEVLISQSHEILEEGVNSNNRDKAIELLLKVETNYQPKDFIPTVKPRKVIYYKLLFFTALLCVTSYFRPKAIIGLGKNKSLYNMYRIWIKFITISVPAILIIGPFWSKIIEWLY